MDETIFRSGLFSGQRVLITGGGTGLGYAMASTLAGLDAEVHICGRRQTVVSNAAQELSQISGEQAFGHELDIRDAEAVDRLMEKIWREHGPLDALVNNAAGNFISRTETLTPGGFNAISDIVQRGTFYATQAVGKRWIAEKRPGAVLSIVVTWVWTGSPFVVPSAMSKAGVDAMTKSLAVEWGRHGIRLNAIAPGVIPTEGASSRLRPKNANEDALIRRNPTQRLGTATDIGNLAAFLLCPANNWVNGQTIALDGGDYLANGAYFTEYFEWTDEDWAAARDAIRKRDTADKTGA